MRRKLWFDSLNIFLLCIALVLFFLRSTFTLLLAGVCMLILGPAGVRAMGLPLLAGAVSILSTATGLTGRLLIALRARRGGK